MTSSALIPDTYRFGGWELRRSERALYVDGIRAKIGGRAFDVLLALAARPGQVVSKSELMDAVWPGLFVEENNLSVQISALRKLIGAGSIANVASQGYQLAALSDASQPGPAFSHAAPTVPARLFGRDAEREALRRIVGVKPLVTIVGTGGVGKTSLARLVLVDAMADWQDGVYWIDLTSSRDGRQLAQTVAKSLGIATKDTGDDADDFAQALAQRYCLIGLDNCEHLVADVVALLGPLLRRVPMVRWLTTSREPLHLVDETIYRLEALDVPSPGTPLEAALRSGALALFHERASAADHAFDLHDGNVALAIDLCRHLDGLPLAIEMAAARVGTFGLAGLHDQIDQRLRLRSSARDGPTRHSTLLKTFAWSYDLLSDVEQRVFRRLEPFAGGFTTALAQALCCRVVADGDPITSWDLLDALSGLVDKSLVQRDRAGADGDAVRLYLLESARDYARHRLEEAGELDAMHREHARVVADCFATAQHDLQHWRDQDWAAKYLPERRNVCVALAWACAGDDPDLLARLVAALAQLDGLARTGAEIIRYELPMELLGKAALPLRAWAYLELGWAHFFDGHRELGTSITLRALEDMQTLGDVEGLYTALTRLMRLQLRRRSMDSKTREFSTRIKQIDESLVSMRARLTFGSTSLLVEGSRTVERLQDMHGMAQRAGFDAQAAMCLLHISDELLLQGRFADVITMTDPSVMPAEPPLRVQAMLSYNRSHAFVRLGCIGEAVRAAQHTLRAAPGFIYFVLDLFALVAMDAGRADDSARLSGRSARVKRERDLDDEPAALRLIDEARSGQELALGAARRSALMHEGAAMEIPEAIALAWITTDAAMPG